MTRTQSALRFGQLEVSDNPLHTYNQVRVSGLDHDFSRHLHHQVPVQLLADWAELLCNLASVVEPKFGVPPFPSRIEFQTEVINSDGPYGSSEDYYQLDYVFFEHKCESGYGLRVSFENFRVGGSNPIGMETIGMKRNISSYIDKDSNRPVARIFAFHKSKMAPTIEAIIANHLKTEG